MSTHTNTLDIDIERDADVCLSSTGTMISPPLPPLVFVAQDWSVRFTGFYNPSFFSLLDVMPMKHQAYNLYSPGDCRANILIKQELQKCLFFLNQHHQFPHNGLDSFYKRACFLYIQYNKFKWQMTLDPVPTWSLKKNVLNMHFPLAGFESELLETFSVSHPVQLLHTL